MSDIKVNDNYCMRHLYKSEHEFLEQLKKERKKVPKWTNKVCSKKQMLLWTIGQISQKDD